MADDLKARFDARFADADERIRKAQAERDEVGRRRHMLKERYNAEIAPKVSEAVRELNAALNGRAHFEFRIVDDVTPPRATLNLHVKGGQRGTLTAEMTHNDQLKLTSSRGGSRDIGMPVDQLTTKSIIDALEEFAVAALHLKG